MFLLLFLKFFFSMLPTKDYIFLWLLRILFKLELEGIVCLQDYLELHFWLLLDLQVFIVELSFFFLYSPPTLNKVCRLDFFEWLFFFRKLCNIYWPFNNYYFLWLKIFFLFLFCWEPFCWAISNFSQSSSID